MLPPRLFTPLVPVLLLAVSAAPSVAQQPTGLEGAWEVERYLMSEGGEHSVMGRIFFTPRDWQVLFFVLDEDGAVKRGSGEGGTYTLRGDRLVFSHQFNLSAGEAMKGLPSAELRMTAVGEEDASMEPTRIELNGDDLSLHFPSGNSMTFRRR